MDISSIGVKGIEAFKEVSVKKGDIQGNGASFKDTIGQFVNDVDKMQGKADTEIEKFASGEAKNIHEVMISMQKAEMSFKFLMQTRNKLVDAYKEVMRLPV